MNALAILIVALSLVLFGASSRRIAQSPLTGPLLFTVLGLAASPWLLDVIRLEQANGAIHVLAEITLILVLFTDAANIDLRQLRSDHNLPARMLLIGMPLTVVLGTLAALWMFDSLSLWQAALLAAILTPTDAALGQSVVDSDQVPIRIRQSLNVESGLNDGIALPLVLIFAALASAGADNADPGHWLGFIAKQLSFGPLAGVAVGYLGGQLVAWCNRRGWMLHQAEGMIGIGLALTAYSLADLFHGNGFIAAFIGGLTFGNTIQRRCKFLHEFTEAEGRILILLTFMIFGGTLIPQVIDQISIRSVIYALLSLTVIRLIPIAVSLLGSGLKPLSVGFFGWFGPRGLASILFLMLIVEQEQLSGESLILAVTVVTVALSITLHGLSANPAARGYGAWIKSQGDCQENRPVSDKPFD